MGSKILGSAQAIGTRQVIGWRVRRLPGDSVRTNKDCVFKAHQFIIVILDNDLLSIFVVLEIDPAQ